MRARQKTRIMILLHKLKNLLPSFLPKQGMAWWLEITTANPQCIYYFGPFDNFKEAETACPGYIEDLENEQAEDIYIKINYCKPDVLTVFDEEAELEHKFNKEEH